MLRKFLSILFLLLVSIYFFQLFRVARNYSQSFEFGDENAHMLGGFLILKGKIPYKDFSSNHQPLLYFFSFIAQKLFPSNTLYQFVGRERMAVFTYAIVWNIACFLSFGKLIFFFTLLFELTKYLLLGNKLLGEVLAMYPLAFLFGIVTKRVVFRQELKNIEILLFSIASFTATFSLLPIWPTLVVLNLILLISFRKEKVKIFLQFFPFVFLTFGLFLFIPFKNYFQETIMINLTYVIPQMNKLSSPLEYLKMLILPFDAYGKTLNILTILTIIFLALHALIFYLAKKAKRLSWWLIILASLILTNTRSTSIKYGDFHLLPWVASYLFLPIVFLSTMVYQRGLKKLKKYYLAAIFLLVATTIWLNFFSKTDYYGNLLTNITNNLYQEHYINYSRYVKYGLAIKALKENGDRLLGIPNDTLVFWVADVNLATSPLESQRWHYELPKFRNELYRVFSKNPPEFYLTNVFVPLRKEDQVEDFILDQLKKNYLQVYHLGQPSELFVLEKKIPKIKEKQWKQLKYLLFDKPNL